MRLRLLIDIETATDLLPVIGELVTSQPGVTVTFTDQRETDDPATPSPLYGRLVGAREAHGIA